MPFILNVYFIVKIIWNESIQCGLEAGLGSLLHCLPRQAQIGWQGVCTQEDAHLLPIGEGSCQLPQ